MAFMTASQLSQHYQSVLKPANKPECEISQVTSTAEKYEVKLSINQFEPEELCVKVVDRYVNVEGRHDEKNEKIGFFTRQFTRRYFLPEGVQPETIRCTYNVDNSLLTISAPVVKKVPVKELTIPIIIVGN
ncbi:Protein lethal(2)essential for life [Orchesella cincta]|uniref:Protein lethal(2)essential for life n=1 Tax=Orchesella cincta TaxID=48709 RepID=A0A1D2MP61_ORCCI|nr:Protein lethal(2)essential for life [Orchesella cincta]